MSTSNTQTDSVTTSAPTLLLGKSLQTGGATLVKAGLVTGTTSSSNTLMTSRPHVITTAGGKPMVAKVLTNAQGQLISMESLLAHQKQQLAAAGGAGIKCIMNGFFIFLKVHFFFFWLKKWCNNLCHFCVQFGCLVQSQLSKQV